MFITKGNIKDFFKENNLRVGAEVYGALDNEIKGILLKAAERAKKNKRTTVLEWDL